MIKSVSVVIGLGGIGEAISRHIGFGGVLLLADNNPALLARAADRLTQAGREVETQVVDVTDVESLQALASTAQALGAVKHVVNTAGLSPNMAGPQKVLAVDLVGAAMVFEVFEAVIAQNATGLVISSMAGHMLPELPEDVQHALAFTPAQDLSALPCLAEDAVPDSMVAYCLSKKANHLRVQAAALVWGEKGGRVNSISPGIIATPLAQHELASDIGDGYRAFIDASPSKRMASPDEVAVLAAFLLSEKASFFTGSDILMDGGVIAAIKAGRVQMPG